MPVYPTVSVRPVTVQRTVTFRGVNRRDRIREGEWAQAENLSSDLAPMLSVRKKRAHAADFGGEVLALAAAQPPAVLLRPENDPDSVILQYGGRSERFACPAGRDPGPVVRMGAALILPGLNQRVNTATGARGLLGAVFSPIDSPITAADMSHPYVLKLCPCDENGDELIIEQMFSAEYADTVESLSAQEQIEISSGCCYAVGSSRRIRRYDAQSPEPWQTMPHLLRVECAWIQNAGFEAGDFVDVSGLPVEWTTGVYVDDYAHDDIDPMMSNNRCGDFDDDPNGLREIAAVGEGYIVLKDVFYTRRVTAAYSAAQDVRILRDFPVMDFVVETGNRLWGCRYGERDGKLVNELYASALGESTAWHRYNGLSTASWAASVGSEGPFTGAAVLDGCPVFFKENCVHRVYPSATGAHRVTEQRISGVAPGCGESLVPFEGGLAYVSHAGVVRWAGGAAQVLSEALGPLRPVKAAAGVRGRMLFLALTEQSGETLWVYDAGHDTWFSESKLPTGLPACFLQQGGHLYAAAGSQLWDLTGHDGDEEETVRFSCTSGLIGYAVTEQKYVSRFVFRLSLPRGSRMDVWLEYDSDGVWHHAGHLRGQGTRSFLLPVRPRRCDHFRIRLTGEGDARIYSIVKHLTRGSDLP